MKSFRICISGCLLSLFVLSFRGYGADIIWHRFIPPVVRSDYTESVRFEAFVKDKPTQAAFDYNGTARPMKDDGTNGDVRAGDGIYTALFQAKELTGKLTESDVYRPFLGYIKLYEGASVAVQLNIFAEIWTNAIPPVSISRPGADIQYSTNLVNVLDRVDQVGDYSNVDWAKWARRFYNSFGDDYDFLNIVLMPNFPQNRFHNRLQNAVKGIGFSLYNYTSGYGSVGRLLGYTAFPIRSFFDGAEPAYQHELGHQWLVGLTGTPLGVKSPHWPIADVASGMMGVNIGTSSVGGQFPYQLVPEGANYKVVSIPGFVPVFNDLELYLMGLLPPDSVGTHFVFNNQDQTVGTVLLGPVTHVSINDIIAALGPRVPGYAVSPKTFRIATILVSNEFLSAEAMSYYNFFAHRAEFRIQAAFASGFTKGTTKPFYLSTRKKGQLDTHIGNAVPSAPVPASPTDRGVGIAPNLTFSWNASAGANAYGLQVSRDSIFTKPVMNETDIPGASLAAKGLSANTVYYWRMNASNQAGNGDWSKIWRFTTGSTAVDGGDGKQPARYTMSQNFPNPFNLSTRIRFFLPEAGLVKITVFDPLGKTIEILINQNQPAGEHEIHWNPDRLSSGVYLVQMEAGGMMETRKLAVLK